VHGFSAALGGAGDPERAGRTRAPRARLPPFVSQTSAPPEPGNGPSQPRRTWRDRLAPLRDRRRWLGLGRDALLLTLLLGLLGVWQTRGHLPAGSAPAVQLRSLGGEPVALESLRGKPVLLAFWAPWCGVCRAEAGNLSWAQRLVGDRARVIAVAASFEDVAQVEAAVRAQGIDLPVLLADDQAQAAFRVDVFPTAYFLDAGGRVKRSASGYTTTLGLVARLLF